MWKQQIGRTICDSGFQGRGPGWSHQCINGSEATGLVEVPLGVSVDRKEKRSNHWVLDILARGQEDKEKSAKKTKTLSGVPEPGEESASGRKE